MQLADNEALCAEIKLTFFFKKKKKSLMVRVAGSLCVQQWHIWQILCTFLQAYVPSTQSAHLIS